MTIDEDGDARTRSNARTLGSHAQTSYAVWDRKSKLPRLLVIQYVDESRRRKGIEGRKSLDRSREEGNQRLTANWIFPLLALYVLLYYARSAGAGWLARLALVPFLGRPVAIPACSLAFFLLRPAALDRAGKVCLRLRPFSSSHSIALRANADGRGQTDGTRRCQSSTS